MQFLEKLNLLSQCTKLPSEEEILSVCENVREALENESESYRPRIDEGITGGLLDFTSEEKPVIVVPDIHARPELIYNLLSFTLPCGKKTIDALMQKEIFVICVGDIMHSEGRARQRWSQSYFNYIEKIYDGTSMIEEMTESLSAFIAVMETKLAFPSSFHCLKGNHENIMNETDGGNYAFRKYAEEGIMVKKFMETVYPAAVLNAVSNIEHLLPVAAAFTNAFVSHAEPCRALSRSEIINAPLNPKTVYYLTWTRNDEAEEGSAEKMLMEFCPDFTSKRQGVCVGGHRPVKEKYALRQNGLYVQIHNPYEQNVALIMPGENFDPEKSIYNIQNTQNL